MTTITFGQTEVPLMRRRAIRATNSAADLPDRADDIAANVWRVENVVSLAGAASEAQ